MALLVVVADATRTTRGTIVLSLDDDDRIISERTYFDWAKAIPREAQPRATQASRPPVGSPGWTLRG